MTRQTEQALATSVLAIDASRRVGWAKHFDSEARLDDALRDLNVARADIEIYRRALSWLAGVLDVYAGYGGHIENDAFVTELVTRYDVVLDDDEKAVGRRAAKRARGRQIRGSWLMVRDQVARSIAKAAGFDDVGELIEAVMVLRVGDPAGRKAWAQMAHDIRNGRRQIMNDNERRKRGRKAT